MNEEINVDEVIRTIQFSEIAQKGYKVMSNDEFDRIVNGILNLQQENQQLKEVLDELNQDKVYWINKCANAETVLDEIREYCTKYGAITPQEQDIIQILDKVKE